MNAFRMFERAGRESTNVVNSLFDKTHFTRPSRPAFSFGT
jgi:hypothetical protein